MTIISHEEYLRNRLMCHFGWAMPWPDYDEVVCRIMKEMNKLGFDGRLEMKNDINGEVEWHAEFYLPRLVATAPTAFEAVAEAACKEFFKESGK